MSLIQQHEELHDQLAFSLSACTLLVAIGPYIHKNYLFIFIFICILVVLVVENLVEHPTTQRPIPKQLAFEFNRNIAYNTTCTIPKHKNRKVIPGTWTKKETLEGCVGLKKRLMKAMKLNSNSFNGTLTSVNEEASDKNTTLSQTRVEQE